MRKLVSFSILFFLLLASCSDNPNSSPQSIKPEVEQPPSQSNIKYEIVRTDNRDPIINLDVYIQDTTQLTNLNTELCMKYNPNKDKFLMIMYFDDKAVAKIYYKKVDNPNTPESELKKLDPHRIAVYHYNPSTHFDKLVKG